MTLGTATVLHEKHPPWSFNGASLDLDFANGRGWVAPGRKSLRDLLSVTRASVGYAEYESGVWLPSASGVARITDKGLLVEEARTNEIRNNSMQGAVAGDVGSGGSLPTNWTIFSGGGLTTTVIGTGTENGVDYVDLRFHGTSSGTFYVLSFEGVGQVSASEGSVFTSSMFLSLVGGDLTNINSINTNTRFLAGAGNNSSTAATVTSTLTRVPSNTATGGVGVTSVVAAIYFAMTNASAIDITLRIGWPQLEEGAFVTSPIRTTTAAATRAADVVSTPCSSAATVYAEATAPVDDAATNQYLWNLHADSQNRMGILKNTAFNSQFFCLDGNVTQASAGLAAMVEGTDYKIAWAFATDDFSAFMNGGNQATDTSGSVPSFSTLYLGTVSSSAFWNSYIKRIATFADRLTDAQLQALTA